MMEEIPAQLIMQYSGTAYLGITLVVSDQFQHFDNIRHGTTAECSFISKKKTTA